MKIHNSVPQEKKKGPAASAVFQSREANRLAFQFVDNRPGAVMQRKLQGMADRSSRANELGAFQELANNSPVAGQAAQLQAMADVKPTVQKKGNANVNDDAGLEKEADVMGAKALGLSASSESSMRSMAAKPGVGSSVQRMEVVQLGRKDKDKNKSKRDFTPKASSSNEKEKDEEKAPKSSAGSKKSKEKPSKSEELASFLSDWNANSWDISTLEYAAKELVKDNKLKGYNRLLSSLGLINQKKEKDSTENEKDSTENEKDSTEKKKDVPNEFRAENLVERLRDAINAIAKLNKVKCPIDDTKYKELTQQASLEQITAEEVLRELSKVDNSITKKYRLKPESFEVDKSGSAGARLKDKNDKSNPWTSKAIESMRTGGNPLPGLASRSPSPLFYGTTEGQRIHVLASRFIRDKRIDDVDAVELMEEVTKDLDGNEKESWPEVSNFWLKGDQTSEVGLVGERSTGVRDRKKLDSYDLTTLYGEEIKLLQEIIIDLSKGNEGNAMDVRKEFIKQFHAEQAALKKDWYVDIQRPDYQHKPGHDSSLSSQANDTLMYEDLICRRMCKWMLHVARYNGQPVVYSLDEIDLSSVSGAKTLEITDTVSKTGKKKLKVPVCTSELREIFRAQDRLENDKPEHGVKFFKELEPVPAPWSKDRPSEELKPWAEYALHLTKKLLTQYPGDILAMEKAKSMLTAFDKAEWSEIIKLYKEMNPSELREQGWTANKKDKSASDSRKEQESARRNKGSELQKAHETINSLQICIRKLNKPAEDKQASSSHVV